MNAEKEKIAIERLKAFNKDDEPYYLCYSGGKDSDTIRILAELADVNFELHNNHTTVDSPTTVYYIREHMKKYGDPTEYRDKEGLLVRQFGDKGFIHFPKYTMWELIPKKMIPPTRLARYCCAELKEKGGKGRRKVTGVRWAESRNRQYNQGLVKIIGKEKGTAKMCEEMNANFSLTSKGGGGAAEYGQRCIKACCRKLLQNYINSYKSDY